MSYLENDSFENAILDAGVQLKKLTDAEFTDLVARLDQIYGLRFSASGPPWHDIKWTDAGVYVEDAWLAVCKRISARSGYIFLTDRTHAWRFTTGAEIQAVLEQFCAGDIYAVPEDLSEIICANDHDYFTVLKNPNVTH